MSMSSAKSRQSRGSTGYGSQGSHASRRSYDSRSSGYGSRGYSTPGPYPYNRVYRPVSDAWWSVGEYMQPGITHQSVVLSLRGTGRSYMPEEDEPWDLSDSLADMYEKIMNEMHPQLPRHKTSREKASDIRNWLAKDMTNGFIRVYVPDTNFNKSYLLPLSLNTPAHRVCLVLGIPPNSLHVQLNGDIIRRLDPYENPLVIQNEYLATIGYNDVTRIQEEGAKPELGFLIRFYTGKPFHDGTYSRTQLASWLEIKKDKMLHGWQKRLCIISGTRLYIHRDQERQAPPTVIQLAKGSVEEVDVKGHEYCLKLTSTHLGEKVQYFLAFKNENEFSKWRRKCKKATSKLPTSADLSNCHLEFLPETIFINDELAMLNLRHNVLRERPIEEDIYTIGWLDDLPRFRHLRSLNIADNDLTQFPLAVSQIQTLVELNVASNKIEEIPLQIANLTNLQALHVHNNHLSSLPDELITLKKLFILVLAFNKFTAVPNAIALMTNVRMTEVENVIMAGNAIEHLPGDLLEKLKYVKKIDLRMNQLTLPPSESTKFHLLEQLTHLDIRENDVGDLDIRAIRTLEYLNCERNNITTLQVNGSSLKNLFAAHNQITLFSVVPKPEWLQTVDLSHNKLTTLPDWLSDCFFLQKLVASHNKINLLPPRLFLDSKKLKYLWVDHNDLEHLPFDIDAFYVEEMHIENNRIQALPSDLLRNANRLRIFNATCNRLTSLPELHEIQDLNKCAELYLSCNFLQDDAFRVVCGYPRLKVLHIAHNDIYEIYNSDMQRLEMLHELNIAGNKLKHLPEALARLPELRVLRAHSNVLRYLPDFGRAHNLKVLDVGINRLLDTSVTDLMSSKIDLLDMSCNTMMKMDPVELETVKRFKDVNMVDMTGQNRALPGLAGTLERSRGKDEEPPPWNVGISETSGARNKICVSSIKQSHFREDDALFAIFDGGLNNEVPKILSERIPDLLRRELDAEQENEDYMKFTLLGAHRDLRASGQKLGASAAVCHITKIVHKHRGCYKLEVANVGDVGVVISHGGDAICLSVPHTVEENQEECQRIFKVDGIITEDNKVNGVSNVTRQMGCAYLYPSIIPDPAISQLVLRPEDQCLIIANKGLWQYVGHQEAVWEVQTLSNPVLAAKRLQDLAQSYGSKENISVLVVKLSVSEPGLIYRDGLSPIKDDIKHAAEFRHRASKVKGKIPAKTAQAKHSESGESPMESEDEQPAARMGNAVAKAIAGTFNKKMPNPKDKKVKKPDVKLKPLPGQRFQKKQGTAEKWDNLMQSRLSDEVKSNELKYSVTDIDEVIQDLKDMDDPEFGGKSVQNNWVIVKETAPWQRFNLQKDVPPWQKVNDSGSDSGSGLQLVKPSDILKRQKKQTQFPDFSHSKGKSETYAPPLTGSIAIPFKQVKEPPKTTRGHDKKGKTNEAYLATCIKRKQGAEIANMLHDLEKTDPDQHNEADVNALNSANQKSIGEANDTVRNSDSLGHYEMIDVRDVCNHDDTDDVGMATSNNTSRATVVEAGTEQSLITNGNQTRVRVDVHRHNSNVTDNAKAAAKANGQTFMGVGSIGKAAARRVTTPQNRTSIASEVSNASDYQSTSASFENVYIPNDDYDPRVFDNVLDGPLEEQDLDALDHLYARVNKNRPEQEQDEEDKTSDTDDTYELMEITDRDVIDRMLSQTSLSSQSDSVQSLLITHL